MKKSSIALAAALLLSAVPSAARNVSDVDVPETLTIDGKALKLNGAGVRKKGGLISVYVGGLYLESTSTDANAIVKSDQAKAVRMVFVRNVDKGKILGAYKEGFENNSKDKMAQLQPGLDKLAGALGDMQKGGVMTVAYVPGKGTTVSQQGGASVTVEGKEFADALFRNWLGGDPADGSLKKAMLAGK